MKTMLAWTGADGHIVTAYPDGSGGYRTREDDLAPSRGVVVGLVLGAVTWAVIGLVMYVWAVIL